MTGVLLRAPQPDECDQLAAIVDQAGGGVVSFLLDGLIPGFSGQSLLAAALRRDQELYGHDSTLILEKQGRIAAMLVVDPAEKHVVHSALNMVAPAARINAVRPMLEAAVPGSLHIDIFWLHKDLGTDKDAQLLLRAACEKAGAMGRGSLGVFCRQSQQSDMLFFTS
ncbi:hypothetical protein LJC15_05920, partial [Desulfovibrio sp. OttesenSCG-928-G11]|nr:hypothetical protein [Desulfovibrio sp. OttesenSCG-928-G11]